MSLAPCTHRVVDEQLPLWRCSHPQVHSRHDVVWAGVCASCPHGDGGCRRIEPRPLAELEELRAARSVARGLGDSLARVLRRLGFKQRAGCGCARRQQWLNRWFPYRGRMHERDVPRNRAASSSAATLLLRFPHGFGDAVQLTSVLLHLAELRPNWTIDIACKRGADSLFRGLCRRVMLLSHGAEVEHGYTFARTLPWSEPDRTYSDSPSTKAEKCLREVFGLSPLERLCRYRIAPDAAAQERTDRYLRSLCGSARERFPVVLLHYQGNSARAAKNLDEAIAHDLVAVARRRGFLPVVLDWETPPRSAIVRHGLAACPLAGDALWNGLGTGDGATLAALVARAAYMVAIDSGPGHVAGATETPTLVVWRRHHPVNYYALAGENITHVVGRDQRRFIRGDRASGEQYFQRRYRAVEADAHYRQFLPRLLDERLRDLA